MKSSLYFSLLFSILFGVMAVYSRPVIESLIIFILPKCDAQVMRARVLHPEWYFMSEKWQYVNATVPEPEFLPESEGEPEGNPEGNPEGEPEGEPEGKPEGNPEGEPEGEPESKPEGDPEGEPEGEPESKPEGDPEGEPKGEPEGNPEGEPEGEPEGDQRVKGDQRVNQRVRDEEGDQRVIQRVNHEPEGEPESKPEGDPEGEPEGEPESKPEGDPEGEPKGEPEGEPEGNQRVNQRVNPEGEPEGEPESEPVPEPEPGALDADCGQLVSELPVMFSGIMVVFLASFAITMFSWTIVVTAPSWAYAQYDNIQFMASFVPLFALNSYIVWAFAAHSCDTSWITMPVFFFEIVLLCPSYAISAKRTVQSLVPNSLIFIAIYFVTAIERHEDGLVLLQAVATIAGPLLITIGVIWVKERVSWQLFCSLSDLERVHKATYTVLKTLMTPSVASRLIHNDDTFVEKCENTVVLACDVVGSTRLASTKTSTQVMAMLNEMISAFDRKHCGSGRNQDHHNRRCVHCSHWSRIWCRC